MTPRPGPRQALALSLFFALGFGCGPGAPAQVRSVSAQEIVAGLASGDGALLLDVRTPAEYASGHVPGALLVPVAELPERLGEVRQASGGREVVVYCERGGRAQRAVGTLLEAGFDEVAHLDGDMSAWRAGNLPSQP